MEGALDPDLLGSLERDCLPERAGGATNAENVFRGTSVVAFDKYSRRILLGPLPDGPADGGPGIAILGTCTPEDSEAELIADVAEERAGLGALEAGATGIRRGRLLGWNLIC